MQMYLDRRQIAKICSIAAIGITLMTVSKASKVHDTSILGIIILIPLFTTLGALIGFTIACVMRAAADTTRDEKWRDRAAMVGYFTLGLPVGMIIGWLLWQPWLWLTR